MCYGGCNCVRCAGEPIKPLLKKQWVQHISGQGEKWLVEKAYDTQWAIRSALPQPTYYYLPKSEYRLCEPPEVWKDVTEACTDGTHQQTCDTLYEAIYYEGHDVLRSGNAYRLHKVLMPGYLNKWAFIVEKKVSE